jgi:cytochrome c oxidase subunit 2
MGFLILVIFVLVAVFFVQIGKARELASVVRGDKSEEYEVNNFHAGLGMIFMVGFLAICIISFIYYIPYILGWGPNTAASAHGPKVDYMFNVTLFFTSIVFFACQFLLFWFGWKYRGKKGGRAKYWSHDERLEMVWMLIPAVVMTFLVVGGLRAWNEVMADVSPDEVAGKDYIEIEATGMQFAWLLRHPGRDNKLGAKHFTKIDGTNPLGQDWEDPKNIDDFHPSEIVLPVGQKVRVRINSRDVLHNFYLPQFRVKMDAVPGMPTYFVFTPMVTSDSMRARYKKWDHWNIPDKQNPDKLRWEAFEYELACAELCGKGHYSMRRVLKVVSQEEYDAWVDEQEATSHYLANVRGKDNDPFKGETLEFEKLLAAKEAVKEQLTAVTTALEATQDEAQKAKLEAAVEQIKVELNTARKTLNVADAEEAVRKATRAASDVVAPVEEEAPEDAEAEDSTNVEETPVEGEDATS